ncbi:MAG: DNA cytosine methyltransferase [Holophagales bacterium]|jgi:DNA (cytosine-5)-methyltransferase 1|nr:DNA cytosine methyltransferase [Holophagales bacterium]
MRHEGEKTTAKLAPKAKAIISHFQPNPSFRKNEDAIELWNPDKAPTFIDLFCGIGGFRLGMTQVGFECVFSCDINPGCQKTYQANFGEMPHGDIASVNANDIPNFDVLCAGFPCQPFSISGKQKGFADTRGTLFFEICRIIEAKRPSVVFLENVKHLIHHDGGRTLGVILEKLNDLGYLTEWRLLNAKDFGVPQNRERIVIIASEKGLFNFNWMPKTESKKLLNFLDKDGPFEYLDPKEYTLIENPITQKESGLCFVGYRNKTIRKVGTRPGTEHLSRVHKQPNRIYSAMGMHPTLPSQETSGRYWVLMPDNRVRKLTIDECFRIMGFPSDFLRPSSLGEQYRQIGNSVCVPMIASVADAIKRQVFVNEENSFNGSLELVAPACN